jgi:hypothetical protein
LKLLSTLLFFLFSFLPQEGNVFCGLKNTAFQSGEELTMKVYYTTLGVYVGAGESKMTTSLTTYNDKVVYHCVVTGSTYSFFDKFFKVRDRYESYIDTSNMLPVKFIRNVDEDGYKFYHNVTFNQSTQTAVSTKGVFKVTPCIQDVISAIYYARNIDYNKYKVGDRIPFDMFLDDEVYHLYLKYEGKDVVNTRFGKFNAIKFKPLLIKGAIFEGGEKMTVWVSDDPNHIILRAESPIAVGSVKMDMMDYKNLRHPLTSLIKAR